MKNAIKYLILILSIYISQIDWKYRFTVIFFILLFFAEIYACYKFLKWMI